MELYDDGTMDDVYKDVDDKSSDNESSDSTTAIPRTLMFIVFLGDIFRTLCSSTL